jgi:hypothetical protein
MGPQHRPTARNSLRFTFSTFLLGIPQRNRKTAMEMFPRDTQEPT